MKKLLLCFLALVSLTSLAQTFNDAVSTRKAVKISSGQIITTTRLYITCPKKEVTKATTADVVTGGVVGAGLGGAAGAAIGGKKGAVAGAVLGGAVGAAAGNQSTVTCVEGDTHYLYVMMVEADGKAYEVKQFLEPFKPGVFNPPTKGPAKVYEFEDGSVIAVGVQ